MDTQLPHGRGAFSHLSSLCVFVFSWLISITLSGTVPSSSTFDPALLVVSYDAFRPEYLNRNITPNLNTFRMEGTYAPFMHNVFPTKTFVNHHSIATGLYPEAHGVLANELYDTEHGRLGYSYKLFHYDESILPIWTMNEKSGRHSGCMMWPGSDFKYDGVSCTFVGLFNETKSWKDRVDTVIAWFMDAQTPANLVMLYIEEPDAHGHIYGTESNVITKLVAKLDDLTKYIQDKLVENNLDRRVNVIHLSDHGMSNVSPPNFIDLRLFVPNGSCEMYGTSPVLQVVPTDKSKEAEIFTKLTNAAKQNRHFKVYNHETLPARWRANNARRMGPILAVADMDYAFQDMIATAEDYHKKYNIPVTKATKYGVHGYDNDEESMHAVFMAKGPLFAKRKVLKPFNMVNLYNLFCFILKLKCDKTDGTDRIESWSDLLARPVLAPIKEAASNVDDADPKTDVVSLLLFICVTALIISTVFVALSIIRLYKMKKAENVSNENGNISLDATELQRECKSLLNSDGSEQSQNSLSIYDVNFK